MVEVIAWIPEHFKTQYGISNFVRFAGETEQPPASAATGSSAATSSMASPSRTVTAEGDMLRVTIDGDCAEPVAAPVAALVAAPVAAPEAVEAV